MTGRHDAFDPNHPRPHFVDEEGNFSGWMSDADIDRHYEQMAEAAEAMAEQEQQMLPLTFDELDAGDMVEF